MRIFLDIGAHIGQTLSVVQQPRWGFDRIYCFEPAPECWPKLDSLARGNVEVCRFGLWAEDATITLNNPGRIGASVSADKDGAATSVPCDFRDAAAWFEDNVPADAEVFAKVNIEGAEAELVQRLAESDMLRRIDHLLIHFDVRKVPSKRQLEAQIRGQLDAAGVEYTPAEEIQFLIPDRGTANWLRWVEGRPATRDLIYKRLMRVVFAGRRSMYPVKRALISRGVAQARVTDSGYAS